MGQRFTWAAWIAWASVLPLAGAGVAAGFAGGAAGGAAGGVAGLGGAGAEGGAASWAAGGLGGGAAGGGGLGAGFAAAGAVGADGAAGFAGAVAGVGGFGAAAGVGVAAGAGVAGRGGAGAGVGWERSSSQIAAQTPHVWILLVEALQAFGPQFGQWCSRAMTFLPNPVSHLSLSGFEGVPADGDAGQRRPCRDGLPPRPLR